MDSSATIPSEPTPASELQVDVAQVCVVDGIWQDVPDHMAAFEEARLGADTAGRGNLYILLDVSGEVEGRAEVERELIETIRREYAARRGSITFALSEALRAANLNLYEINITAARETRRMAGISAALLRGQDLYIAQAGPSVAYVEIDGGLTRYPQESDWFTEDQPLISPQGNASAPLGVRREFACDLFHTSVMAGDVFILAARALTQLASTEELAQIVADRSAEDIANQLEEVGNGSDLSALVAELVDPRDKVRPVTDDFGEALKRAQAQVDTTAIPQKVGPEVIPEFSAGVGIDAEEQVEASDAPVLSTEATTAAAVVPEPELPDPRLAQLRTEREQRRAAQIGLVRAAMAGFGGALVTFAAALGGALARVVGLVDWDRVGAWFNRSLNTLFIAVWRGLALVVRLTLPGAPARASLIPRRASQEPIWLKGVAVILPVVFIGLAFTAYKQQDLRRQDQSAQLVEQARLLLESAKAKKDTDHSASGKALNQALATVQEARSIEDSPEARSAFYDIQNELNQFNGIQVFFYFLPIATLQADSPNGGQVVANGRDVYVLDRGGQRISHYVLNDSASKSEPAKGDGIILKSGDKAGTATADQVRDITWTVGGGGVKPGLAAVGGGSLWVYDPAGTSWRATAVDTSQWSDIRAAASFGGNLYLLDAGKNQLWKYVPGANGYSTTAAPYLPANSAVDLSRAVDLTIDGDIWVLNGDGSVLRFRGGQRIPFQLGGLDTPLKSPVAIYTRPEVDALIIADSGNQRIVELDKNGKFVRQFKPRSQDGELFSSFKAMSGDETIRKIYFINANAVYMANVP